jgi:hypothetical protein
VDILAFIKRHGKRSRPLVLSESLCGVIGVVSEIFGQTWHMPVLAELRPLLGSSEPPSGERLQRILNTLVKQAAQSRPGLDAQLLVQANHILYKVSDRTVRTRKYQTVIMQGEGDTLQVGWWVSAPGAGRSSITYLADRSGWKCASWEISEQCQKDLDLLVEIGGEVLGFLSERNLLPENSLFQVALEQHLARIAKMREAAAAAAKVARA